MSSRQPLSTLPLAQFIPVASASTPSKRQTPLRQSAHSMSLLPSPFLASTTPRATTASGPLSTLYERSGGGGGASPVSRSRTPNRTRLIDQEEQQELEMDETSVSTTPRRLLDMFVQSAEKERGSPSQLSDRVLPSRKAEQAEETVPAWDFFFDDSEETENSRPAAPSPSQASLSPDGEVQVVEEESEEELPENAEIKENIRLPPRQRFRTATSNSLLSAPTEIASAPASLSSSATHSPTQPPQISLPVPSTSNPNRIETPPKTPEHEPLSPTYPTSYPPLNTASEVESGNLNGFSEGGIGSFESTCEEGEQPLAGLGLSHFESIHSGRGKKRLSGENGELSDGKEEKRLRRELD